MKRRKLKEIAISYLNQTVMNWEHQKVLNLLEERYDDLGILIGDHTINISVNAFEEISSTKNRQLRVCVNVEDPSSFWKSFVLTGYNALYDVENREWLK